MVSESVLEPSCRICLSRLTRTFVDLGMLPMCQQMTVDGKVGETPPRYGEAEPLLCYPLHALVCDACFLVQLNKRVVAFGIADQYSDGRSAAARQHPGAIRSYCQLLAQRLQLAGHSLVVQVAAEDGFLLQHFRQLDVPVLGIECAANEANSVHRRGFPTLSGRSSSALARRLAAEGERADLIIVNNLLAQLPDPNDFMAGIASLLASEGTIVLDFPYLQRLIAETQFDTMSHSHVSYFSLTAFDHLAKRNGLEIIDAEEFRAMGGTLRLYLTHIGSSRRCSPRVAALHECEMAAGLRDVATYARFSEQVRRTKRNLLAFLIAAKDQGKSICGYGPGSSTSVLLNACTIGRDMLDFIVTDNPANHDRCMPGTHIPMKPIKALDVARPDYVLLLHRHLKNDIAQRQLRRISQWGGRYVIPTPDISLIEPIQVVP